MKPLFCALLLICVTGCAYSNNSFRSSSPLHTTVERSSSPAELRAGILTIIPLGSSRESVAEKIKDNFVAVPVMASETLHPNVMRIEIKLSEHGAFGGKDEMYARFVFDRHAKLEDVTIYTIGSWL